MCKMNYCTQNNGNCKTCSLVNYNRDCQNNFISDKLQIRISGYDRHKLKVIAQHYFGKFEGMQTATLEMLIEKEYKAITEPNK